MREARLDAGRLVRGAHGRLIGDARGCRGGRALHDRAGDLAGFLFVGVVGPADQALLLQQLHDRLIARGALEPEEAGRTRNGALELGLSIVALCLRCRVPSGSIIVLGHA